jgi:hypothetical protein
MSPAPRTTEDMSSTAAVNSTSPILPDGERFNFPKLPAEIRLAIIHQTFEPQVVRVHVNDETTMKTEVENAAKRLSPNPIALEIDREWRTEAISHYDKIHVVDEEGRKKWPIIYIRPANDTLVIQKSLRGERYSSQNHVHCNMILLLDHLNQRYDQELSVIFDIATWKIEHAGGDSVRFWVYNQMAVVDIAYDSDYARRVLFTISYQAIQLLGDNPSLCDELGEAKRNALVMEIVAFWKWLATDRTDGRYAGLDFSRVNPWRGSIGILLTKTEKHEDMKLIHGTNQLRLTGQRTGTGTGN